MSAEWQYGQRSRGYQWARPQDRHDGSTSSPRRVAWPNGARSSFAAGSKRARWTSWASLIPRALLQDRVLLEAELALTEADAGPGGEGDPFVGGQAMPGLMRRRPDERAV